MRAFRPTLLILALLVILVACAAPPAPPQLTPGSPVVARPSATLPAARSSVAVAPTLSPIPPTAEPTAEPRDPLFDSRRLSYEHNFNGPQIQAFLEARGSVLAGIRFQVGGRSQSFTDVLVSLSSLYSLNPKLLLALVEQHGRLLSTSSPTADQLAWAVGYHGDGGGRQGLYSQLRWAARELRYAIRDYAGRANGLPAIKYADGSSQDPNPDIAMSRYVLARVLAPTTVPGGLGSRLEGLLNTYTRLFDDPRLPPHDWPAPAEPFLTRPTEHIFPVTSFFDHDAPFLRENGSLFTYLGRQETDIAFAYDGHTGWDYGLGPPDAVLAAAPGEVIFAGNSDDGCATPAHAVIIDHGNGYRTLYWHLYQINVEATQRVAAGEQIGIAGESGCAVGAHLHFQVQYLGRDVDPYGWCGAASDPWAASPAGQVSVWLWADMPSPCGAPGPGVIVVDDTGPGFSQKGVWQHLDQGYGGGSLFAPTSFAGSAEAPWRTASIDTPAIAAWRPELPAPGRYRVLAYMPYALNGLDESHELRYLIYHRGGVSEALVDAEEARNWWADLGEFDLVPGEAMVLTSTLAGDDRMGVWVDAVAFVPVTKR